MAVVLKRCSECHAEFQDTVDRCPTDDSELEPEHVNPLIGTCLAGRYEILTMLGSGGAGVVYKAQHLKMDKPVAVKMMHSHMMSQPEKIKAFCDEARTIAQLKHHNIVTLYDFGLSEGNQAYLVMDYIDGPSLKKFIEIYGPVAIDQMRYLTHQIIDGLTYAHTEGIVHQDLKPENIILSNLDQPGTKATIVDFGLATLSGSDKDMGFSGIRKKKFIGSPYYMSPEQCLSTAVVDARSDIYSLAIVLYEAMTGRLPYERKSAMAMMDSHVRETPLPFKKSNQQIHGLDACTELTNVFNKAMAKDPESRYIDISHFGAQLDDALARDGVKVKAIRHRNLTAEQALVHVRQTMHGVESNLQLPSSNEFLQRQAEIEQALLGSVKTNGNETAIEEESPNFVLGFFKKITNICRAKKEYAEEIDDNLQQEVECPNCKTTLKPGIQFCLNCQRTVSAPVRTKKLSEARYHPAEPPATEEQLKAKDKLQKLRQKKLIALAKAHQVMNYVLIIALIAGAILMAQRYFHDSSSQHNANENSLQKIFSAKKLPWSGR